MAFDSWLFRTAALFTPDKLEFGADLDLRIDHTERQHRTFVVAVAGEHRQSDRLAAFAHDFVVRSRRIVRQRKIDVLVRRSLVKHRRDDLQNVLFVPGESDFLAMLLLGLTLDGFFADVIVVEFHERAVAESIRRHVVIFDIVRVEAAAD